MKPLSLFTLRNAILFEASLVQYAHFVCALNSTAASPPYPFNNSTPPSQCTQCAVSVGKQILTYPSSVSLTTESVTATVIPYVTQYDNGTEVTTYSTFTFYAPNGTQTFTPPKTTPLTWLEYGTTLTYPTTYLAFPSPYAGFSSYAPWGTSSFCYVADYTPVPVSYQSISNLIFPSTADGDLATITPKVYSYIDGLPTLTAILGGKDPHSCSQSVGTKIGASFSTAPASSISAAGPTTPLPVVHTSVAVLTTTGQAVITQVTAGAQHSGGGDAGSDSGSGDGDHSGSGSDNGGSSNNGGSGSGSGSGSSSGSGSGSNNGGSGSGSPNSGSGSGSGGGLAGAVNSVISQWQQSQPGAVHANPTSQMVNIGSTSLPVANGPSGTIIVGGVTLAPGASTVVNGVTVSNPNSGSGIIVGGSNVHVTATAGSGSGSQGSRVMTVGSSSITAGPSGAFVVGGQTLTPGGTVIISGTTYSLAPGGSVVVINGQTQTLGAASSSSSTTTTTTSSGVGGAIASGLGISGTSTGASASSTKASVAHSDKTITLLGALIGLSVCIVCVWL